MRSGTGLLVMVTLVPPWPGLIRTRSMQAFTIVSHVPSAAAAPR